MAITTKAPALRNNRGDLNYQLPDGVPADILDRVIEDREARQGKPSLYTADLAAAIVSEYARGKGLLAISELEWSPGLWTLYRWMERYPEFAQSIKHARKLRSHTLMERHLQLAEHASTLTNRDDRPDGIRVATNALQWQVERLNPDEFAPRSKQEVSVTHDIGQALLLARQRIDAIEGDSEHVLTEGGGMGQDEKTPGD